MIKIQYHKYHCLGNDFLVIDRTVKRYRSIEPGELARNICQRNTGVGADGVLMLGHSKTANCYLDIYNSDGTWAEKSGNGLRITAAYLGSYYGTGRKVVVQTKTDTAVAHIVKRGKSLSTVEVSLGKPSFETRFIPMKTRQKYHINSPLKIDRHQFIITALSVGNPHAVIFVDNYDFDWQMVGSIIENHSRFPNRTNVEFVKIINRSRVILNDWERGAGATGSSGTGAGATVAAGVINGYLNRSVRVEFPLGTLSVEWSESDDHLYLTGPVEFVCRGEYLHG